MCVLCAYTTRLVSGWPISRGQARCGSCQCLRERASTRGLRKGAPADFNPSTDAVRLTDSPAAARGRRAGAAPRVLRDGRRAPDIMHLMSSLSRRSGNRCARPHTDASHRAQRLASSGGAHG